MSTTASQIPVRRPPSPAARVLMALAAVSFATASLIHAGVTISIGFTIVRDAVPDAGVPEAVIAVAMAAGTAVAYTRRPAARGLALAATLFAILGTCVGLRFTLLSGRTGDVAYHAAILVELLVIAFLLLVRDRRSLTRDQKVT